MPHKHYRVAVTRWSCDDGIAVVICDELTRLGHEVQFLEQPVTDQFLDALDVVFSFGPYGNFLQYVSKVASIPADKRPLFVHWNTEGLPDLRIPWPFVQTISSLRSWTERLHFSNSSILQQLTKKPPLTWVTGRMMRFRYVGDYYYARRQGWLDVFADTSAVYGALHNKHGLNTVFAPWGGTPRWSADLNLERDIDVLWMGKRGSKRRSRLLDQIRQQLADSGVRMYVADGDENDFIFDDNRTEILNRSKITLNLTRTWYDDNFSRFAMAAPNRSLFVSETLLPHCPQVKAGIHYVSAPVEKLAETILYYLKKDAEREKLIENAYQLVTTELTFRNSVQIIMNATDKVRESRLLTIRNPGYLPSQADSLG